MNPEYADDGSVLQRLAESDPSAVQDALDSYGSLVWSLAWRLSPSKTEAEQATQEIFTLLWRHAGRYRPADGSARVFVAMLARRRLLDRLRPDQHRLFVERLPEDVGELAERTAVDPAAADKISADAGLAARALQHLSAEQQAALKLSVLFGLGHRDVAACTGANETAVNQQIRRGLLQLCQRMSDPGTTA